MREKIKMMSVMTNYYSQKHRGVFNTIEREKRERKKRRKLKIGGKGSEKRKV